MVNPENFHSADGSMLGFLYQIQRALVWLSSSDSEAWVGVEVDDDITVKLIEGAEIHTIYEQAKHAQTSKIPYADRSVDLWKTISIWVDAVTTGRMEVSKSTFSFLTNKKLPVNRLVNRIKNETLTSEVNRLHDNKSIKGLADEIKHIAAKLPKSLQPYAQIVVDCPQSTLVKLVDRMTVFDNTYTHSVVQEKKHLKNNLSLADDIPFDYIYQGLFGYVADTLIMCWKAKQPGWISVKAFNNQYSQLLADFKRKSFYEKAVDSLPVDSKDVARNRAKLYVEQLKRINCSEKEVIEAIHDFIRAASERSRFAQDGEISKQKFDLYFQDLFSYWESVSRPKFKFAKKKDLIKTGYEVYYFSLLYKGKLNSYEPEQAYTHKGSYHHLVNQMRMGWHPEWHVNLKKKDDDTE